MAGALFQYYYECDLYSFVGFVGAALALFFSSALLFFGPLYSARQIVTLSYKQLVKDISKIGLAAIGMYIVILLLKPYAHFGVLIVFGGSIYLLLLYLLGGYTKKELNFFLSVLKKTKPDA